MIVIKLKDEEDAALLFERFLHNDQTDRLQVKREENCITIHLADSHEGIPIVSSVLTDHVITTKEEEMLLELITATFYFEDPDEQEQILSITKSIIQGEKTDLPGLDKVSSRKQLVFHAFSRFLTEDTSFYYESFIRFRLKSYQECLEHYVEMGIDEYKLEQEYQNFVENLRALLKKRRPVMNTVHLVFNREFALYDQLYRRVDENVVQRHLEPGFRQKCGMDIEPSVLVTLIGIAPRKIFLYTDHVDAGMIQTIQNVFQERVIICPTRSCDFHS